jgi:hypothetical protein
MNSNIAGRAAAILHIAPAVLFFAVSLASPALANDAVLTQSCTLLMSIKNWLFQIVYVLGAIGLVIIAVSAFLGRFKFAHLIALGGGLFIVAVADMLITFISSGTGDSTCV